MIRSRIFIRNFRIYLMVSMFTLTTFTASRVLFAMADAPDSVNTQNVMEMGPLPFVLLTSSFVSLVLSALASFVDALFLRRILDQRRSVLLNLTAGGLIRITMILLVVFLSINFFTTFFRNQLGYEIEELTKYDIIPLMLVLAFTLALATLFIEIDRKLGPGNLRNMMRGKFFRPREEERIFMFIDMRDSTAIAEKLGHNKFSRLLRDCFHDVTVVDNFRAEVYQYVGDEVVLTWTVRNGLKKANAIRAFYAFIAKLEKRSDYYQKTYGLQPYFKAGVHVGPAIITEVGDIKREITYHGDTINTTARIQDMCNVLKAQLLISETLQKRLPAGVDFKYEDAGTVQLKGKEKAMRLFRATPVSKTST